MIHAEFDVKSIDRKVLSKLILLVEYLVNRMATSNAYNAIFDSMNAANIPPGAFGQETEILSRRNWDLIVVPDTSGLYGIQRNLKLILQGRNARRTIGDLADVPLYTFFVTYTAHQEMLRHEAACCECNVSPSIGANAYAAQHCGFTVHDIVREHYMSAVNVLTCLRRMPTVQQRVDVFYQSKQQERQLLQLVPKANIRHRGLKADEKITIVAWFLSKVMRDRDGTACVVLLSNDIFQKCWCRKNCLATFCAEDTERILG